MDGDRFDGLAKLLGNALPRRGLLAQVGTLSALGLPTLAWFEAEAAKNKKKKKRRRRRRKNRRGETNALCDPTSRKKVAMCHVPPGNPQNAHVTCIAPSGCNGHQNDPGDCVCGLVPSDCLSGGQPFPQCADTRCRPNGDCQATGQTCGGACDLGDFPCPEPPITSVPNCRCLLAGKTGTCVTCPTERICGSECCQAGQICCGNICVDASSVCGGICGNVCTAEETCCGSECVPTANLCPDCTTVCEGTFVCCDNECVTGTECCEDAQCLLICQTGVCANGTCERTPVTPNQPGPFCNNPGKVCCLDASQNPECCGPLDVCTDSGCCTPLSCADIPEGTCGQQDDGCGGLTFDCACADITETCNDQGICVPSQCVPDSFEVACAGLQCGPAGDGCGNDYNCGDCTSKQSCVSGVCKASKKKKRCIGGGLAGQPCSGKCKCKGGRRCNNGRCCEPVGDGSVHCTANNDCCPGLMCARRRPGQHKVCMPKNAKFDEFA